jgi:hypothetical protein
MTPRRAERQELLDEQLLIKAFARLDPPALGVSCGIVSSVLLFAVTVALVLNGPSESAEFGGQHVGPHLGLLSYLFAGYDVTWGGAFIGLAWGFAAGYLGGFLLAALLNFHHRLYLRLVKRRLRRQALLDG